MRHIKSCYILHFARTNGYCSLLIGQNSLYFIALNFFEIGEHANKCSILLHELFYVTAHAIAAQNWTLLCYNSIGISSGPLDSIQFRFLNWCTCSFFNSIDCSASMHAALFYHTSFRKRFYEIYWNKSSEFFELTFAIHKRFLFLMLVRPQLNLMNITIVNFLSMQHFKSNFQYFGRKEASHNAKSFHMIAVFILLCCFIGLVYTRSEEVFSRFTGRFYEAS